MVGIPIIKMRKGVQYVLRPIHLQEIHIINQFDNDFYGEELRIVILGYIRPELNYTTKGIKRSKELTIHLLEALIEDIQTDIKVAIESLKRPAYHLAQSLLK